MKTAISVPDEIFKEVENFAREHHFSRSEVFVRAATEYLEKMRSREILRALNAAYLEEETEEEKAAREAGKGYFRRKIRREKY
ncbi:MAG: hypothetical protein Q8J64_04145 [Thermodesulfovibrionales bacterium]|nr:hypothetical protein [Thermodesulfovibrionales bacterium]